MRKVAFVDVANNKSGDYRILSNTRNLSSRSLPTWSQILQTWIGVVRSAVRFNTKTGSIVTVAKVNSFRWLGLEKNQPYRTENQTI